MNIKNYLLLHIFYLLVLITNAKAEPNVGLEKTMADAHFVVYGGIKSFKYSFFLNDKQISKEEALNLIKTTSSNESYVVIKYEVVVDVQKSIKGSISEGLVTFSWLDLADSMSPHIAVPDIFEKEKKVFWYSTKPIKNKYLNASVSVFFAEPNEPQIQDFFNVK